MNGLVLHGKAKAESGHVSTDLALNTLRRSGLMKINGDKDHLSPWAAEHSENSQEHC